MQTPPSAVEHDPVAKLKSTLEKQRAELGDCADTAETILSLSIAARTAGQFEQAEKFAIEAIDMFKALNGDLIFSGAPTAALLITGHSLIRAVVRVMEPQCSSRTISTGTLTDARPDPQRRTGCCS